MQHRLSQFLIILSLAYIFSCEDEVRPVILGSSNLTLTGAETGTINYSEVEFRYLIQRASGSAQSTISINVGKIGSTSSVLSLILTENDNSAGFEIEKVYSFQPDPNGTVLYSPSYFTATNTYTINSSSTENNWIKFVIISDKQIEGEIEVNLEDSVGEKVKLSGSFVAVGDTITL